MAASISLSPSATHQHHLYRLWNGQGYSMLRDSYYEDALTCFNQAIAIDPDQAESWYGRGEALSLLGWHREAFSCFNTALELAPNYSQAWALQARMLFYLNRYTEALESCNQALRIQPRDPETWIMRGATLQQLGQSDAANASYEQALHLKRHPRLTSAIKAPIGRIWQLGYRLSCQVTGRQTKAESTRDRVRQDQMSHGWATTMTYSAMLVSLLILLQLIQLLQPTHSFVPSQFPTTATLWIQTQAACQESGRNWQNGICWERRPQPPLL